MDRDVFYFNKTIVNTEWWLADDFLPMAVWARLRVLSDGSADVCFELGGTVYGFESPVYAGYFLSEDEYIRFNRLDAEDERKYGIRIANLKPPQWDEFPLHAFRFIGTY